MYFTIRKNSNGQYWWRAKADGNNETLAASEMLSSKRACYDAIEIVQTEAADAPIRDQTGKSYTRKGF
jgi:uncharacterized protein YegP (UPF0339 family)